MMKTVSIVALLKPLGYVWKKINKTTWIYYVAGKKILLKISKQKPRPLCLKYRHLIFWLVDFSQSCPHPQSIYSFISAFSSSFHCLTLTFCCLLSSPL